MRKIVGEDERFAHTLDGEQPVLGVVLPVCEKHFGGDTGTKRGGEIKHVGLARNVREGKGGTIRERLNYEG